jgi:hypothetical protein
VWEGFEEAWASLRADLPEAQYESLKARRVRCAEAVDDIVLSVAVMVRHAIKLTLEVEQSLALADTSLDALVRDVTSMRNAWLSGSN